MRSNGLLEVIEMIEQRRVPAAEPSFIGSPVFVCCHCVLISDI